MLQKLVQSNNVIVSSLICTIYNVMIRGYKILKRTIKDKRKSMLMVPIVKQLGQGVLGCP